MLGSEEQKLRLEEEILGAEAKLEDNLLNWVDDEEEVRSSVTVGNKGEEWLGKKKDFVLKLSNIPKFGVPLNSCEIAAIAVALGA